MAYLHFCAHLHHYFNFFQKVISEVLGIKCNRVVCRVKRMGGGFGGKESRMLVSAVPVAVAAYK